VIALRAAVFAAFLLLGAASASIAAANGAIFATPEQGRAALTQRDDFVARLSPFDRAARLKKDAAVSEREYLEFVGASVVAWSADESRRVATALDTVGERFRRSKLVFPSGVMLIRTTGSEEGNAAYTRGSAMALPPGVLDDKDADLAQVLSHELFHIISRRDSRLRDRLYRVIGFEPCPDLVFPADLGARRITNPDAPRNDHRIRVGLDGAQVWAIPILYADSARYDPQRGGEFFDYLQFRFALDAGSGAAPRDVQRPVDLKSLTGFFEQVGRNTQYLIHPEEILADNFAIALAGKTDVPTPSIPAEILRILRDRSNPAATRDVPAGAPKTAADAAAIPE
jgi:hypothetical protein